jgi:hypothetical protein
MAAGARARTALVTTSVWRSLIPIFNRALEEHLSVGDFLGGVRSPDGSDSLPIIDALAESAEFFPTTIPLLHLQCVA